MTTSTRNIRIFTENIEPSALEQLERLLAIDIFSASKIRIMPDVHAGAGCVIGFTGNLGERVIPNIVGVDIGCGMRVTKFRLETPADQIAFHDFNSYILETVPSGHDLRDMSAGSHGLSVTEMEIYREAKSIVTQLLCYRELKNVGRIYKSIGTLGGGNHFIELNRDDNNLIYLVIHTGSRNLGKQVAEIYQRRAIRHLSEGYDAIDLQISEIIAEYKATGRRAEIQGEVKRLRRLQLKTSPALPEALCYIEGQERENYLHDMRLCQRWAELNRQLITMLLMKFFNNAEVIEQFESVHNYISSDNMIRKGAISATRGERCIIPLNMRDGSIIATGLGNEEWNCSAPHGAGRILSRGEAMRRISLTEFEESMQGIYSESVCESTIDESPMAYKPSDEIISKIGDTVAIDTIIRPIFNFKATR